MIIRAKDLVKMWGVALLSLGAVTICALFWNYCADLMELPRPNDEILQIIYDGQVSMSKVTCACAGGILGLITVVVLAFFVVNFVNKNSQNLGILKALGYGAGKISANFLLCFFPVVCGTAGGFALAMSLAKTVYKSLTEYEQMLPTLHFRWEVFLCLVILPAAVFAAVASLVAFCKLKRSALSLIKNARSVKVRKSLMRDNRKSTRGKEKPQPTFLQSLRRSVAKNNPLTFVFVAVAAWGFSAMIQMTFTMASIEMSDIAPALCAPIGVMMGVVILFVALQFIFGANAQYLALMQAFGYTKKQCAATLLNAYRPVAWVGFVLGAPYQYGIMYAMVGLFGGAYDVSVPFSWWGLLVTACAFAALYEGMTALYKRKIFRLSLKIAVAEQ